jgi:hypothetical protein
LYVYALAEPGLPHRFRVRGRSLRVVTIADVAVITEPCPAPPAATTEVLYEQHAVAIELAKRCPALLPARFGTLMGEARLRDAVAKHRAKLLDALSLVRWNRQMTVRVVGAPRTPKPLDDLPSTGTAFLRSRRARAHDAMAEAAVIRSVLGGLTVAERIEPDGGGLRVTVFHLVPQKDVEAYLRKASSLQRNLAPHRVTVTGPWPPFAFSPELF